MLYIFRKSYFFLKLCLYSYIFFKIFLTFLEIKKKKIYLKNLKFINFHISQNLTQNSIHKYRSIGLAIYVYIYILSQILSKTIFST